MMRCGRMQRMAAQIVTLELQRWIGAQARAGVTSEAMLESMVASGWRRDVARGALRDALRAHATAATNGAETGAASDDAASDDATDAAARAATNSARDTARAHMPEPRLADGAHSVFAGDREVRVVGTLALPRVIVFADLLAADECSEIIALARERLTRSETVLTQTGGTEISAARTSEGMFFERAENALVARIEQRIAALLNWPLDHGEGLQVLRYAPGAEYKPHYDYFDPDEAGTPLILRRGGQRVASLVMYLNTPARGGATVFPDAGLAVAPQCGNAVFFSYPRAHPDTRTLHGGAPVLEGEKWVATKWLREGRFD